MKSLTNGTLARPALRALSTLPVVAVVAYVLFRLADVVSMLG